MRILKRKKYDGTNPTQMIVNREYLIFKRSRTGQSQVGSHEYYTGIYVRKVGDSYHFTDVYKIIQTPNTYEISSDPTEVFASNLYDFTFADIPIRSDAESSTDEVGSR